LFIESHTDWQVCGEAGDGDAGVSLVQQLKPDLLVLDLLMPVMNGFDAARKIVAISPMTKIVLFTGHADEEVLKEAYSVGIRAVLSKDADHALQRLLAALNEADDTVHAA
jgi:two-component system nitrate/nitrite response regulator NarL